MGYLRAGSNYTAGVSVFNLRGAAASRNEGTGLGLAVVKRVISQHGGSITAANTNGAVFEIRLPRKQKKVNDEQ